MKKMIALLLCLLGSSSLWAQENTVLGTGALANSTPSYAIKEIVITNPGSYSRPTIDFGGHQVTWEDKYMSVGYEFWMEGTIKSSVDLSGVVPHVVGGHGNGATVTMRFSYLDSDGKYIYSIETEEPGRHYSPLITLSPKTSHYGSLTSYIMENGQLTVYYYDPLKRNLYAVPPLVDIPYGGATAIAVLDDVTENIQNTAIGYQALYNNTSGKENTALGSKSLHLTTGSSNIGIGNLVGSSLTTGNDNVFIGNSAGNGITTGFGNVMIGGGRFTHLDSTLYNSVLVSDGSGNSRVSIGSNGNMKVGYGADFSPTDFKLDVNGGGRFITGVRMLTANPERGVYFHDGRRGAPDDAKFLMTPSGSNPLRLQLMTLDDFAVAYETDYTTRQTKFFYPVKGVNATSNDEFATLGQVRDISSTTDRNLTITNTYPYLELKAAAWSGPSYVQAGVELSSVGVGDYMSFLNPEGKGFNFKRGAVNDMVINPDGNVGIGITTPQEKLAVNGKIRAREVKVEPTNNWPDYVFEEGYQPMSLAEIATFVKQHKHLPEVPSAKEVAQNGLELGEMNKILLKKIEELTLMLIDQNKKNQEQDELIKKMMAEIKEQNSKKDK